MKCSIMSKYIIEFEWGQETTSGKPHSLLMSRKMYNFNIKKSIWKENLSLHAIIL